MPSRPDEAEAITTPAEEPAMSITRLESIPQTWNDERDVPFFTTVAHLFDADLVFGAGVLLAANSLTDDDVMVGELAVAGRSAR